MKCLIQLHHHVPSLENIQRVCNKCGSWRYFDPCKLLSQHPQIVRQLIGEQGRKKAESYSFVLLDFDGCCALSCSGSKRWRILPYLKIAEPKDVLILCTFCTPLNCNGSMFFFFFFSALREKRLWTLTWRNRFPEQASWAKTQLYRCVPLKWQNENWHIYKKIEQNVDCLQFETESGYPLKLWMIQNVHILWLKKNREPGCCILCLIITRNHSCLL